MSRQPVNPPSQDPITKLAGVRSWRASIRVADVGNVTSDRSTVTIEPYQRDAQRIDVFIAVPELKLSLDEPTPEAIGRAVLRGANSTP